MVVVAVVVEVVAVVVKLFYQNQKYLCFNETLVSKYGFNKMRLDHKILT